MKEQKEITIYDIADLLKISPATVSRGLKNHPAISKKTKKLILEAATDMGYRTNTFASNLRRKKTNTLGVIVPRLNSSFMSDVIAGMEKEANLAGYNLIISQSLESEKKEILNAATMFNSRVDGLLVSLAYDTSGTAHFDPFRKKNVPVLFFDRADSTDVYSSVIIDNYQAAYDTTTHLIEQGCKKLVHLTGNLRRNVYSERLKGFRQALTDHDISIDDHLVFTTTLSQQEGVEIAGKILQMTVLPDGIFVANDLCAASCMLTLRKAGVNIPQDIAITGFNNDPVSSLVEPNLTTVHYHGFAMGETAIQTMVKYLHMPDLKDFNQSIVMRHELIIRESSLKKGPATDKGNFK